jgi:hypothetical protein
MKQKLLFSFMVLFFFLFLASGGWLPTDVRLDTGDTPGANDSYSQRVICNGSNVYVVWSDSRNGESDIYLNYSTDSGAIWLASEIRIDTGDTAGANGSGGPDISVSGDNVYVVWYDSRNGAWDIYFNYSLDAGVTWQASDIRLDTGDTAGASDSWRPKISSAGNNVYVVWFDTRNGNEDIYFNYSMDAGATWQASDTRLDTGDTPGASISWQTQIASSGNNVYVVWYDYRDGGSDIYFNYSMDAGATWQASDTRLDTGDSAGANDSIWPSICCDGTNVYVAWYDERHGELVWEIYFNSSTDAGANWQATDVWISTGDTPGARSSYWSDICCDGANVYAVWSDKRDGEFDIYFNSSVDSGMTWKPSSIRLDVGDIAGAYDSPHPKISCSGDYIYTVWYDYRNGERDIYSNYSINKGATWQSSDIRLDTGDSPGANISEFPEITSCGNNVYVAWRDYRNGAIDIYFNKAAHPVPDIKANGLDGPITIGRSDTLAITVQFDAGTFSGEEADWWLVARTPLGWYYYHKTSGWLPGREVTLQIPLRNLPNREVFNMSGLPVGNYTFYFGVDLNKNGNINISQAYYDQVNVTINP